MIHGGYAEMDAEFRERLAIRTAVRRQEAARTVPTGDLGDPATVEALTFPMPACEGECGNPATVARFDATSARFIALCAECEPIPFELVDGTH